MGDEDPYETINRGLAAAADELIESQLGVFSSPFGENPRQEHQDFIARINLEVRSAHSTIYDLARNHSYDGIVRAEDALTYIIEEVDRFEESSNIGSFEDELSTLGDSIGSCREAIMALRRFMPPRDVATLDLFSERPVLPDIKPAPIQAIVVNHVLTLTQTQTRRGSINYASANRVREGLRKTLQVLIEEMPSSSNVDRAYVRACSRLLEYLSTPIESLAIEELGLQFQLVEKVTRRIADELGATMFDEIEHVLTGVGVLLNQFDEWRRYLEELAKTKLDPSDGEGLVANSVGLLAALEKPGAPVDPVLIGRLRAMVEPAATGLVSADTVAIPLVCSLSNIFSALSHYAIDHYHSVGATHGHAVAVGAVALLTRFSVDLLEKFCPVLSKYQPLAFIISVVRYLLPMYSQGKDVTSS